MKRIRYLIISLLLLFLLTVSTSITAHATDSNSTGTGDGSDVVYKGGVNYDRTAYLVYIVDENGSLLTPVKIGVPQTSASRFKSEATRAYTEYVKSRLGSAKPSGAVRVLDIPVPFDNSGHSNAQQLKSTLLASTSGGSTKARDIIVTLFGTTIAEQFGSSNKDMYLIFEPVYWMTDIKGSHKGQFVMATCPG